MTKIPTINEAMEKLSADLAVNTAISQKVEKHMLSMYQYSLVVIFG